MSNSSEERGESFGASVEAESIFFTISSILPKDSCSQ
jgi:hypothetical protein